MKRNEIDPKCGWDWDEGDLAPLETPIEEHYTRAPEWLAAEARSRPDPKTPFHLMIQRRLGAQVVVNVPIFVPALRTGYVLDFLLPDWSLSIEVAEPLPESSRDLEYLVQRDTDLLTYEGIFTLRFPPAFLSEQPEEAFRMVREALGLRPVSDE